MAAASNLTLPVILIPAYQPGERLVSLVDELLALDAFRVIVVNDGSSQSRLALFEQLKRKDRVTVLSHGVNLGKGAALKSGFNHVLVEYPQVPGVITVDADGQHLPQDVLRLVKEFQKTPEELLLGTRKFEGEVPFRSMFGNQATKFVFKMVSGKAVGDTQTGLRAIPTYRLGTLMRTKSTGYEFEMDMLLMAVENSWGLREVPITTVYIDNNSSSHFNPLLDSAKIYFVFLRFAFASIITALIDFVVFYFTYLLSGAVLLSSFFGRLTAGTFNFIVAKRVVFKSKSTALPEAISYGLLVLLLMFVSNGLISSLQEYLGMSVYTAKLVAEGTLFILSFSAQRLFVFGRSENASQRTDWDSYYDRPFRVAPFTRKITTNRILTSLKRFTSNDNGISILELGGADSCFFSAISKELKPKRYLIVDNNRKGLQRFKERYPDAGHVQLFEQDLLLMGKDSHHVDVCFSVGVIEHFSETDMCKAIRTHFACTKPGGIVLITFPTPTFLYRGTRFFAELLGIWKFPDEVPRRIDSVVNEVSKHGEIMHVSIIWPIFLTQGLVVARVNT
jgi:glycosyltransferase involved in cell wall biosynthesis